MVKVEGEADGLLNLMEATCRSILILAVLSPAASPNNSKLSMRFLIRSMHFHPPPQMLKFSRFGVKVHAKLHIHKLSLRSS